MGLDRATATRLIKKWGVSAQVMVATQGASDGGGGLSAPTLTPFNCLAFETTREIAEELSGGALRGITDQLFVVSIDGLAIRPTTNDFLTAHGQTFKIKESNTVRVKGDVVFYIIRVIRFDP